MALPVIETTKKGAPSTSYDTLKLLQSENVSDQVRELLDNILNYRGTNKLVNTYLQPFEKKTEEIPTLHTRYNVGRGISSIGRAAGTRTGRISSSEPNLQNIPSSGNIRQLFIPSPGNHFFEADYSQMELSAV